MVIIKKAIPRKPIFRSEESVVESLGTNVLSDQTSQKFSSSGLTITGTVQTSPEWYESLQKTVVFVVDQRMEQNMPVIEKRIGLLFEKELAEIKKMIKSNDYTSENEIMSKIIEHQNAYLKEHYKGKVVALTFEGRIVGSGNSRIDVLKQIDTMTIPKEQVFIYPVPLL